MKLLTAVNLMLPKLGEHPVTSLTIKHNTLAIILPEVQNELIAMLLKGWWFNEYLYTATPDSEKFITLGADTLAFVPLYVNAAVRGVRLFNPDTLSYEWDSPVEGRVTQYVAFDDLPESVAQHVWYSALVNTYITDLGITPDVQAWQTKSNTAYTQVLAEHLRNRKYSTANSRRFRNLRNALKA